jgi:ATP-binding protein involved in chromosome partitioning
MTKRIAVVCIKGGVGKTTVTCGVALALRRLGRKVGVAEIDITGSSIWKALGLSEPPPIETDTAAEKIIPSPVQGLEVFTIASYYKSDSALILWGEDTEIVVDGQVKKLKGTGRKEQVTQMLEAVRFSADLDYLLYDLPPAIGDEMLSLWKSVHDIWGALVVSQPTALSRGGVRKTLDLLTYYKLPLLGLVVNMDGVVCPECHAHFNPFADTESLEDVGIPIIERIPFTKDPQPYFDRVASYIEDAKPVRLGGLTMMQRLARSVDGFVGRRIAPVIASHAVKKEPK